MLPEGNWKASCADATTGMDAGRMAIANAASQRKLLTVHYSLPGS
jgi:hypothetical protein